MNYMYMIMFIGLTVSIFGLTSIAVYAQEEQNAVDVTNNIIVTVIGFAALLIPIIRRELQARNVQNPAIFNALQQAEILGQRYVQDQEKFVQMAQILYKGLETSSEAGKQFVEHIENKEKVKLVELDRDLAISRVELEKFIELYNQIRPEVKKHSKQEKLL